MSDGMNRARAAALAGLAASLVGIGLARFAYTPLLPALVDGGWFDAGDAAYLGAANLAGYLIGALGGARIMRRLGPGWATRAMMALAAISLLACIQPVGFLWFFVWRLISGIAGGAVMVSASSLVMLQTPADRRGRASGIVFTGVGIGVVISAIAMPWLIDLGLSAAWAILGTISLLITAIAWPLAKEPARQTPPPPAAPMAEETPENLRAQENASRRALGAVIILYGLCAFGMVPHMVFIVDYVARGLDRGFEVGAFYWALFGLGALIGPMTTGRLADRVGFTVGLRLVVAAETLAVAMLVISHDPWVIGISTVIAGMLAPGIVPVTLGRVRDLAGSDEAAKAGAWGRATGGFALGQAGAAYLLAWIYDRTGDYDLLFVIALCAPALGLMLEFWVARGAARGTARGTVQAQRRRPPN